ncbi:MAG: UvrD-helicase domain-containing protein, partial [Thiobacillaceae bacterium]
DEFQDTNPLQWQCLRAWLDAYGLEGERPTLFLVGDPKQSIYRFRRAEPRLFAEAAAWLEQTWGAVVLPNDTTRRLAPRVAAWVNAVFSDQPDYPGFHPHTAHAADLPGLCEVIRVPRAIAECPPREGLRDPLSEPPPADPEARQAEAQAVAERIRALVGRLLVRADEGERPARYGDILVLTASRTGLKAFEQAFKAAGIPYIGVRRGGLLDTLEAADLIALLTWLTRPGDDLALAQVLRSPLFAWDDSDLLAMSARPEASWHERLTAWARAPGAPAHVSDAATRLSGWLALAGRVPAHDLLDRIFHEGEVETRYAAAAPPHLRAGVLANLRGLLALSLSFSGGRYPSLPRFLDELTALRDQAGDEAPDEPPAAGADAVRLMTIHAAKGLEAPVVFLIKADDPGRDQDSYGVLLDWPATEARPTHFSVYGRKDWGGQAREDLFAQEQALEARERLNLLYVAMTRARQALFISGLDSAKPDSWLGRADTALGHAALEHLPAMSFATIAAAEPVLQGRPAYTSAPPLGARRKPADAATQRGVAIHRYLELACRGWDETAIARDLDLSPADLAEVRTRARTLLTAPGLRRFFDPAQYRTAYDELSFVDADGQLRRIDRLVDFGDEVWVLDYKTGDVSEADPKRRAEPYRDQLAAYRAAMGQLYPGRRLRAALIFADASLLELLPD